MSDLVLNLIYSLTAGLGPVVSHVDSFLGSIIGLFYLLVIIKSMWSKVVSFILSAFWTIEKFFLGIIEMFEYMVNSLLGIGSTVDDYTQFANTNNLTETFVKTFKAIVGVALVLMIMFTIVAIVKQEYSNITKDGGPSADNNKKGPILLKLFRGIMSIVVLPIAMIIIIGGVNSVLTSFSIALKGETSTTVAASILTSSSYDANKYRRYANTGTRIPIIIEAYNVNDYNVDEKTKLVSKIKSVDVQNKLIKTGQKLNNTEQFLSFNDSLIYENNKLSNSSEYGDFYESFICTPEQYQVMAEFVDYAELTNTNFYIKSIDDDTVSWKYVDSAVFNTNDKELTINYLDASNIANGDKYSITYSMSYDVTSPISNSINTLQSLLGLGDFGDNTYYEMERDEDSVNVVQWANEKASIHFSQNFKENDPKTWTDTDEIIMFEYYHFSSNNTFSAYALSDFAWSKAIDDNDPVAIDVYKYSYKEYLSVSGAYTESKEEYCVLINSSYYYVEQSDEEVDEYGNYYYVLKSQENFKFLSEEYTSIYENTSSKNDKNVAASTATSGYDYNYNALIKLSDNFDINNTSSWTYTDQIIVYEYYKDLSYNNELYDYTISDFKTGVKMPTYTISTHEDLDDVNGTSKVYVLINGTYYQVKNRIANPSATEPYYELSSSSASGAEFLESVSENYTSLYNYTINLANATLSGIKTGGDSETGNTADDIIIENYTGNDSDYFTTNNYYYYDNIKTVKDDSGTEATYTTTLQIKQSNGIDDAFTLDKSDKYENFDLRFSAGFDYKDTSTWTYKDYFLFYIYAKYLSYSGNVSIEQLKVSHGLVGEIGKVGLSYNTSSGLNTDILVSSKTETELSEEEKTAELTDDEQKETNEDIVEKDGRGITNYLYVFKINSNYTKNESDGSNITVYLKIDDVLKISDLKILSEFNLDDTYGINNFESNINDSLIVDVQNTLDSVSFTQQETESRQFSFSSSFTYGNVSSWTMQDYILLYLNENNILDIPKSLGYSSASISNLDLTDYVYNSLVYKIDSNRFYCFGSSNKIYLNEKYIGDHCGTTLDKWLNTSVTSFINSDTSTPLSTDKSTIINYLYDNNNFSDNVFDANNLIKNLVDEYCFTQNMISVYDSAVQYTYHNNQFIFEDLSTWTKMDLVIYALNGKVSNRKYTFNIATNASGDLYCEIGNYYVSMASSSPISATISNTYQITSKELDESINTNDLLIEYYNQSLNGNIIEDSKSHYILARNVTYTYQKPASKKTCLDAYLAYCGQGSKTEFSVYHSLTGDVNVDYLCISENDDNYKLVMVDNINIIDSSDSQIILSSNASPFTDTGSIYTPFEDIEPSISNITDLDYGSYNFIDAAIYYYSNSISSSNTYKIYEYTKPDNSKVSYVSVVLDNEVHFIKYDSTTKNSVAITRKETDITGSQKQITVTQLSELTTGTASEIISKLYDEFYDDYIISMVSDISSIEMYAVNVRFSYSDITSWSPFKIILNKLGVLKENDTEISARIATSADGERKYYVLEQDDLSTYVDITDLVSFVATEGSEDVKTLVDNTEVCQKMFYNIFLIRNGNTIEQNIALGEDIVTNVCNNFLTGKVDKADLELSISVSDFDVSNITTWTWFDVIYYYFFNKVNTNDKYVIYKSNNETFIKISNGNSKKFINYSNSSIFSNKFSNTNNNKAVEFNLGENISKLAIINYKITANTTGSFVEYQIPETTNLMYSLSCDGVNYYVLGIASTDLIDSSTKGSGKKYEYISSAKRDNLSDWNMLDIVIKSLVGNGSNNDTAYNGLIYEIGGKDYFAVDSYYINLSKVEGISYTDGDTKGSITCTKKFIDAVGYSDSGTFNDDSTHCLLDLSGESTKHCLLDLSGESTNSSNNVVRLYFSDSFVANNYDTWKLSDYILYYVFKTSINDDSSGDSIKNFKDCSKNFQEYVNAGYMNATTYTVAFTDSYGGTKYSKVLVIGSVISSSEDINQDSKYKNYIYVDYNLFNKLYVKPLIYNSSVMQDTNQVVDLTITGTSQNQSSQTITNFGIYFINTTTSYDLAYKNYYYFTVENDLTDNINDLKVTSDQIKMCNGSSIKKDKYVNLKLSSTFDLKDVNTWTVLDYIIIYEYSRAVNNNIFEDLTFDDLRTSNFICKLYNNSGKNFYALKINGNYYNLKKWVDEESNEVTITDKINTLTNVDENGVVSSPFTIVSWKNVVADGYKYDFRVLANTQKFILNKSKSEVTVNLVKDSKTLSYTATGIKINTNNQILSYNSTESNLSRNNVLLTYYRALSEKEDNNGGYEKYRVSFTLHKDYTLSALVREVNWPQKIMNDMRVLYPNLNWSTLIATDGWIDTLGDYYSGTNSGQYTSTGNSANITAVGMVLSEFFLSVANERDLSTNYAEYEYSSMFDEDIIKSLMLSIMGEENYNSLAMEAKVFVDLFNSSFAPVLDEIAKSMGIEILDGSVSDLTMSIYKAYLATAILSSDLGEYLYTLATRVYAQYTIYESFAKASDDYATYYAYINEEAGVDGDVVSAFKYSTFRELVKYENENLEEGDIPMFTFNYETALKYYVEHKDKTILQRLFGEISDFFNYLLNRGIDENFDNVLETLEDYYYNIYLSNPYEQNKVESDDPLYCYMLDVYYSIRQELMIRGQNDPQYLTLYKKYIDGELDRWAISSEVSIDAGSLYIKDYNTYKVQRVLYKALARTTSLTFYNISYNIDESELDNASEDEQNKLKSTLKALFNEDSISTDVGVLRKIFEGNSSFIDTDTQKSYVDYIFPYDFESLWESLLLFFKSEYRNDVDSWKKINNMYKYLGEMIEEFSQVQLLDPGARTDEGSLRPKNFGDNVFDETALEIIYKKLTKYHQYLGSYISAQNIIDKVDKTSITFTLAQYGNNFVEDGYKFTIENKQYTLKASSVSTQRLAEYVYGGSFLEKFGVGATFTNGDFDGAVTISTIYDEKAGHTKGKLEVFPTLRKFASKLADYTGKLYYLTNLKDLSPNTSDSILLTDSIYVQNTMTSYSISYKSPSDSIKSSLEYLILDYIIQNEYLSLDTMYSLCVIDELTYNSEKQLENTILNDLITRYKAEDATDEQKKEYLREYLWYVQTTDSSVKDLQGSATVASGQYGYYGYYIGSSGYNGEYSKLNMTANERISVIFKKLIIYLTGIDEENDEVYDTNYDGITLDFEGMNFKDLKEILMKSIVDYVQYEVSTGKENTDRYLTLFYLISGEFNYYISENDYLSFSGSGEQIGRTISLTNKDVKSEKYTETNTVCYKSFGENYYMRAEFRIDSETKGMILKLAGIQNRPIEELVNLKYNDLYDKDGCYDEADGDTFVICTYDEEGGIYYPVLARSADYNRTATFKDYQNQDFSLTFKTKYYDSAHSYPIVAKGVITADGMPTAIKMVNNEITYYRMGVTVTANLDEASISKANVVSEVTTIGYTSYVPKSTFTSIAENGSDSRAMYTGANSNSFSFEFNMDYYCIQYTTQYYIECADDYYGVSVLDDFNVFFDISLTKSASFHLMLVLGFIVIIPILFKAALAAMRRILDLMFLILIGPLMISMNSLDPTDSPSQAYNSWKEKLEKALLSAFGIVVSFSLYHILIQTVLGMTFVTENSAVVKMLKNNPSAMISFMANTMPVMKGILSASGLNAIVRFFFIIVASQMIQTSADMIGKIITGDRVENSFNSQLTDISPLDEMIKLGGDMKKVGIVATQIYSGQLLEGAKESAIEKAKQMIPGSSLIASTVSKIKDGKKAKAMAEKARSRGVDEEVIQKNQKQIFDNEQKIRELKKQRSLEKANQFNRAFNLSTVDSNPYTKVKDTALDKARDKYRKESEKKYSGIAANEKKKKDAKKKADDEKRKNYYQSQTPDKK